jgi:hypothetical protein
MAIAGSSIKRIAPPSANAQGIAAIAIPEMIAEAETLESRVKPRFAVT